MKKILIIDDEVNICALLQRFFSRNGFEVETICSGNKGLQLLKSKPFDMVLCDYRLEDSDGATMLSNIHAINPDIIVIIMTGYSDVRVAVEMMKQGAYDYISKPLYPDDLLNTVRKAFDYAEANKTITKGTTGTGEKKGKSTDKIDTDGFFIKGNSRTATELYRQAELVAPTNYSVIIYGESGTGKESIANIIHRLSDRAGKPFFAVDCGALSKELASSELFGHEKGSFTGAIHNKTGAFELAHEGTLFLDEVANLPYDVQISLLRVIQERKIKKIGGTREIPVDVRIVVASNEKLWNAVKAGKFREDLYHRFNEFSIQVPPLRHRENDIFEFADNFLQQTCAELNKTIPGFTEETQSCFKNYSWPGNIRELKNVIKRACLLTADNQPISVDVLPLELLEFYMHSEAQPVKEIPAAIMHSTNEARNELKSVAQDAEYEKIMEVLKKVNFNKSKAALALGVDRKTLYNKLKLMNLA